MIAPRTRALIGITSVLVTLLLCVPFSLSDFDWVPLVLLGLWLLTTATVGGMVVAGRPGHQVGSLMMWAALGLGVTVLLLPAYATYGFEQSPRWPAVELVGWLTMWATIPAFSLFIHVLLRFPTGVPPSPRWRWVSRAAVVAAALTALGYALRKGEIDQVPELDNPLGSLAPSWVSDFGIAVGDTLLPLVAFSAIVSLFVRYRRAALRERQQMKWFIFSVSLFPVAFFASQLVQVFEDSEEEYLGFLVIVAALMFVPVSMGIGILKHRLYDIDVVLNRALVYGALTGILGASYFGLIVLMQRILPVTGDSDIAVAASTLAVAGLFRPLRSRVQDFIDRRFYRRKYDTAETLSGFSGRLREQVDLDSLSSDLVAVVAHTMQPAHASLWLRERSSR